MSEVSTFSSAAAIETTDYAGNKIYKNNTLKRVLVDGGYIESGVYLYYLADHLGNNRVVADQNGKVLQNTHYYPFGMSFAESTGQDVQTFKYNGKELDKKHESNMYDYSARFYEQTTRRFSTVDPYVEKYYSISPYVYCANNLIKFIDKDGKQHDFPPIGGLLGSPENLHCHIINQETEKLQIHAAKPVATSAAISGSIPVNLINTIMLGLVVILITKSPIEGTLGFYVTFEMTKRLPDMGGGGALNIYHVEGDERIIEEQSFAGKSNGSSKSVTLNKIGIGINKSEAEIYNGNRIVSQGISIDYGKSLPITGKKGQKTSYLIGTLNLYNNENERYNSIERTNDYYIRRYTNLSQYLNVIK